MRGRWKHVLPISILCIYECLSVEPDKNEPAEILDGQWVACMKAVTDVNLMSFDHVAPVISYRDVNGQLQLITATLGCVLNVLPTAEGEFAYLLSESADFGSCGSQC